MFRNDSFRFENQYHEFVGKNTATATASAAATTATTTTTTTKVNPCINLSKVRITIVDSKGFHNKSLYNENATITTTCINLLKTCICIINQQHNIGNSKD